jgi:hypothetical protein
MTIETKTGFYSQRDRYFYDFGECSSEHGWAQIDTKQDASYYGTWTNPEKREIFTYCEGDTTLTKCTTDDEYRQALNEVVKWNKDAGYWLGIDPGFRPEMKDRFVKLGFAELLH